MVEMVIDIGNGSFGISDCYSGFWLLRIRGAREGGFARP